VYAGHLDAHGTWHALGVLPFDVDQALRIGLAHLGTVGGVDGDAATAGDEAGDALAGKRLAALRETDQHLAVEAGDADGPLRRPRHEAHEACERALALLAAALELQLGNDLREHLLARDLAVADLGEERVLAVHAELLHDALERAVLADRIQLEMVPAQVLLEDLAPDRDRALALLRL